MSDIENQAFITLAANDKVVNKYKKKTIKIINIEKAQYNYKIENPVHTTKVKCDVFEMKDIFSTMQTRKHASPENESFADSDETNINLVEKNKPTPRIRVRNQIRKRKLEIDSNQRPNIFNKNLLIENSTKNDNKKDIHLSAWLNISVLSGTPEVKKQKFEEKNLSHIILKTMREKNDPSVTKAVKNEFDRQDPLGMVKFTATELCKKSEELRLVKTKLEKITNMFGARARSLNSNQNNTNNSSHKDNQGKASVSSTKKELDKIKDNMYGKYFFELNQLSKKYKPKMLERTPDPEFTIETNLNDGKLIMHLTNKGIQNQKLHTESFGTKPKSHLDLVKKAIEYVNHSKDQPEYKEKLRNMPRMSKEDKKELVLVEKLNHYREVMPAKIDESTRILRTVDQNGFPDSRKNEFQKQYNRLGNLRVRYKNKEKNLVRRSMLRPQ